MQEQAKPTFPLLKLAVHSLVMYMIVDQAGAYSADVIYAGSRGKGFGVRFGGLGAPFFFFFHSTLILANATRIRSGPCLKSRSRDPGREPRRRGFRDGGIESSSSPARAVQTASPPAPRALRANS